jgi:hypothetical protein
MPSSIRRVFFACNYTDKRIKSRFDKLKKNLEQRYPIECILIDKSSRGASDFWRDIKREVKLCDLQFFDVTGFRPNVVLELGYALSEWQQPEGHIFISWSKRKVKKTTPRWLLTDIGHLQRKEYAAGPDLDRFVEDTLQESEFFERLERFNELCRVKTSPTACPKYQQKGIDVMKKLRGNGASLRTTEIRQMAKGTAIRAETLIDFLKEANLVKRELGRYGQYYLLQQ